MDVTVTKVILFVANADDQTLLESLESYTNDYENHKDALHANYMAKINKLKDVAKVWYSIFLFQILSENQLRVHLLYVAKTHVNK